MTAFRHPPDAGPRQFFQVEPGTGSGSGETARDHGQELEHDPVGSDPSGSEVPQQPNASRQDEPAAGGEQEISDKRREEGGFRRHPVQVSVSDDEMEATALVLVNGEISRSSIINALQKQGVTAGYDELAIDELTGESGARGFPVTVARGVKAGDGVDARLDLYFDRDPRPKITYREDGHVDYKELGIIQQVKEDDLLAIKTPPREGDPGFTATGKPVPGKIGKEVLMLSGQGTRYVGVDNLRVAAARSGVVSISRSNEISVSDQYIVEGDVDFNTGNVRFNGALVIRGNVLAGFEVTAGGDIDIRGVVEDAYIHCGGNLYIRGGFLGKGNGVAKVCGATHVRFLENQTLISDGDVHIAEEIIFGDVVCGGEIVVQYGKGAIIGGSVSAVRGVRAKIAGNVHNQRTRMITGVNHQLSDKLDLAVSALGRKQHVKGKVQLALDRLVRRKYETGNPLTLDDKSAIEYLYHFMSGIDGWVEEIGRLRDNYMQELKELEQSASIRVDQRTYPGVMLTIGERTRMIEEECPRSEFRLVDGVIAGSGKREHP